MYSPPPQSFKKPSAAWFSVPCGARSRWRPERVGTRAWARGRLCLGPVASHVLPKPAWFLFKVWLWSGPSRRRVRERGGGSISARRAVTSPRPARHRLRSSVPRGCVGAVLPPKKSSRWWQESGWGKKGGAPTAVLGGRGGAFGDVRVGTGGA